MMAIDAKDFTKTLRANGHKLTQSRRALIQTLVSASKPLSIQELHERAQLITPDIGLVTVYRALDLFMSLQLVRPVHLADNRHGYAAATPGHTHHLVCRKCRRVVEFEGCDLSAFLAGVMQRTGYKITGHWLELEGLCAECAKDP